MFIEFTVPKEYTYEWLSALYKSDLDVISVKENRVRLYIGTEAYFALALYGLEKTARDEDNVRDLLEMTIEGVMELSELLECRQLDADRIVLTEMRNYSEEQKPGHLKKQDFLPPNEYWTTWMIQRAVAKQLLDRFVLAELPELRLRTLF